jgi:ferredoxin like protein
MQCVWISVRSSRSLLLYFCPANVYRLEKDRIVTAHEGCLECGSRRIARPYLNIEWRFPTGGYGISHRFG